LRLLLIALFLLGFACASIVTAEGSSNKCVTNKCEPNQYLAGFAKLDISPKIGESVPTMMASPQMLQKIQDPLYAKVLVIGDSQKRIGFVALDLLFLSNEAFQALRQHLLDNSDLDNVIVTVTHSHSGVFDHSKFDLLKTKALKATQAAMSELQPVEIGASSIEIDEAYNRRIHLESSVEMFWVNPERKTNRPVDTALGVIHIRGLDGTPLVSIVNYSAHPTITMDLENVVVSADYPSALSQSIDENFGGEVLFLLGAAGDVNPYDSDTKPLELAIQKSKVLGSKLGSAAVSAIKNIDHYSSHGRFAYLSKGFSQPEANISALILTPTIAVATFPGEYFNDFGQQLKAKSSIEHTFFIGYANGSIGYVPTQAAAKLGGYGADLDSPELKVAQTTGQQHINIVIKMLNDHENCLHERQNDKTIKRDCAH